jgi:HAD superfamily hydrolase (TIGR01549 family)
VATAAILDVDGTLVDSNYQHAIAWYRALREHDVNHVPVWRIHRHIGMGGDQLVAAVAGEEVEQRLGDAIRATEKERYGELIDEVAPFEGAHELLVELRDRDHPIVFASSAKQEETEHYVELVGAGDLIEAATSSADVDTTKPAPDIVVTALEKARELSAVMVGDSPWDVDAAARAEVKTIAVLTGGFCEAELRDAGAVNVFESLPALIDHLDATPLR